MNIAEFDRINGADVVYRCVTDGELECDFSLGVRTLYPGCNMKPPVSKGCCNIFSCSLEEWRWFLESVPFRELPENGLFLIHDARTWELPSGWKPSGNVLFLRLTGKALMSRIANLSRFRYLTMDMDERYSVFWEHIKSARTEEYAATANYLENLPFQVQEYLSIIVIHRFTDANGSMHVATPAQSWSSSQILSALRVFFRNTNVFYDRTSREYIVLYTQAKPDSYTFYYPLHDFSYGNFSELLGKYHLHAGFSNAGRAIEHLYTVYLSARTAMTLGEQLNTQPRFPNIYHAMEYIPYQLVQLCLPEYMKQFGHDNIVYLVHPAVVSIVRYDSANNTQLLDTLYTYLRSGCGIQETARALYVHRNTVTNRLQKIRDITSLSIDNAQVQSMLQISCEVLRYYRDIMRKTFE